MEEITKKLMSEQRNDEEEADFLVEMMEEKPHSVFGEQGLEEMQNEAKFYLPSNYEEVKKGIPPDLEKTLEMFKKLLKIKEVNKFVFIKYLFCLIE